MMARREALSVATRLTNIRCLQFSELKERTWQRREDRITNTSLEEETTSTLPDHTIV